MVSYREYVPQAALQDSVKRFWTLEREYTPANPTDTLSADNTVELIFNFGSAYVLDRNGLKRQLPPVYVVGLHDGPMTLRSSGVVRLVAARFYAWGLLPFLSLDGIPGNTSALILDADWCALVERLRGEVLCGRYDRAVERLETFLLARRTPIHEPYSVPSAATQLYQAQGQIRIAGFAAAFGLSMGRFGTLTRSLRFEKVRARLMVDPTASLSELAREFSFADAAHLAEDFRAFSGTTPEAFAAAMRSFRAMLHDHQHVVFLQTPPLAEVVSAAV